MVSGHGLTVRCFLALAVSCLMSCSFESDQPFITPATASYPLPDQGLVDLLKPDAKGAWAHDQDDLHLSIVRTGPNAGSYVLTDPDGKPEAFLLKRIDAHRYVVQGGTEYALLVEKDGLFFLYGGGNPSWCDTLGDADLKRFHIERFAQDRCHVHTLADLEALFRHLFDASPQPNAAFRVH